ncbi:type III polyketide synthase [Paracraurococcus lichenis]|uniref:Type III polyketide synthase n=1 Tax=Paracraurococcus lichenis TaxID=3064888 RepID=A0ABT9E143_9PROT|nr:type III polyketide synthase [Paracraurococcus sp. LOR1-02]MDO9709885.1 type III polyketide synthase [Paracraurococcus sp. LOR1-02]
MFGGVTQAHINRIATALPRHEVHDAFRLFAGRQITDPRVQTAFARLAERSQIDRRYSVLEPLPDASGTVDAFYLADRFPGTGARMARYEAEAPALAEAACQALGLEAEGPGITHLILASCTGFAAPGLDHWLIRRFGLPGTVERSVVGFMGCQAAINALKLAHHVVRSDRRARVLVLNLELCSLHLQPSAAIEQLLCFLLFADGCSAALVTAEAEGLALEGFHAALVPEAADQITWRIGDGGFDMTLSGFVPLTLARALPDQAGAILAGARTEDIDLWAVHPGGRSVLDAVMHGLDLPEAALDVSRAVLREHGNMSSATVMFVLERMMREASRGQRGCALAFGPGLSAETMRFRVA